MMNPWRALPSKYNTSDLFGLCDHFFGNTIPGSSGLAHCFFQLTTCHFKTPPSSTSLFYEAMPFRDLWPLLPYTSQEAYAGVSKKLSFPSLLTMALLEADKPSVTMSQDTTTVRPGTVFEAALDMDQSVELKTCGFELPILDPCQRAFLGEPTRKVPTNVKRRPRATRKHKISSVLDSECALPSEACTRSAKAGLRDRSGNAGTTKTTPTASVRRRPLAEVAPEAFNGSKRAKSGNSEFQIFHCHAPPSLAALPRSTIVKLTVAKRALEACRSSESELPQKKKSKPRRRSSWTGKRSKNAQLVPIKPIVQDSRPTAASLVVNFERSSDGTPVVREYYGCWTCRIRHLSCPADGPPCTGCKQMGFECDMAAKRPQYLKNASEKAKRLQYLQRNRRREDREGKRNVLS